MFDPVLARLRDLGCMGLMMSASPDEGVLLGIGPAVATAAGSRNACHPLSTGSAHPDRLERTRVTPCVVEVGPATVRGPRTAAQNLVSTALECIDDEIALLDEAARRSGGGLA